MLQKFSILNILKCRKYKLILSDIILHNEAKAKLKYIYKYFQ